MPFKTKHNIDRGQEVIDLSQFFVTKITMKNCPSHIRSMINLLTNTLKTHSMQGTKLVKTGIEITPSIIENNVEDIEIPSRVNKDSLTHEVSYKLPEDEVIIKKEEHEALLEAMRNLAYLEKEFIRIDGERVAAEAYSDMKEERIEELEGQLKELQAQGALLQHELNEEREIKLNDDSSSNTTKECKNCAKLKAKNEKLAADFEIANEMLIEANTKYEKAQNELIELKNGPEVEQVMITKEQIDKACGGGAEKEQR